MIDMLRNISCRRFAPLLVPYGEGMLEERARDRVASHLASCPSCRAEAASVAALAALLRANPPAPASPASDLWARLESQIRTESASAPATSPRLDAPGAWTWEWRGFARSFGATAVPVAAVVACFMFVLQNNAERMRVLKLKASVAAVKNPELRARPQDRANRVVISLASPAAPKQPPLPVKEHAAVAALTAKAMPHPPAASAERSVERITSREPLRNAHHSSIQLEFRPPRLVADMGRHHQPAVKMPYVVAPVRVTKLVAKAEHPKARLEEDGALLAAAVRADVRVRGAAEARLTLVAWGADNSAAERDVPADSVADVMEQLRRHQSLFSYGDQ